MITQMIDIYTLLALSGFGLYLISIISIFLINNHFAQTQKKFINCQISIQYSISESAQMDQEELQFDVYYQGSSAQFYALLYPLTGPNHPLFEHFKQEKAVFNPSKKLLEFQYTPQNFSNIDKQKQQLVYKSTSIPSQSNYFYSTFQPQTQCFVWRNISNFLQMRPQNKLSATTINDKLKNKKEKEDDKQMIIEQNRKIQLQIIESGGSKYPNKVQKQIKQTPLTNVKQCWECSKQEYFSYLAK